jgi:predicted RNA-binding protein with PUA-like domain
MARFLVKTEPRRIHSHRFSATNAPYGDGVANRRAQASRPIRKGDTVIVSSHRRREAGGRSRRKPPDAYPDPKLKDPKRPVIDLTANKALVKPVTLAQVKADAMLKSTPLARQPRLSVMPLSEAEFRRMMALADTKGA